MTDNFENKVAVDGPVVNEGELGSSTFSPGPVSPAGPLQRWNHVAGNQPRTPGNRSGRRLVKGSRPPSPFAAASAADCAAAVPRSLQRYPYCAACVRDLR